MALQVEQRRALVDERAELLELERPQRRGAGLEALHVVERALLVDLGPRVPETQVGGAGLRGDGIRHASSTLYATVRMRPMVSPFSPAVVVSLTEYTLAALASFRKSLTWSSSS